MMSADHVVVTSSPPPGWEALCRERNDLFHSAAWQAVLREGFGCASFYLWEAPARTGCALPVFSLGPFRLGYLGFPAGGGIGTLSAPAGIVENLNRLPYRKRIDVIRVPLSGFGKPLMATKPSVSAPETCITELQTWDPASLPAALRRNLKKFERSNLRLRPSTDPERDADRYFRLYLGTVERHRGRRRYNRAYFRAVLWASLSCERLRCTGAYAGDELAGFVVAALSGDTAFYLHGASDAGFQRSRPSDALFQDAIQWAKEKGAAQFDMMSSPPSQPGLVRFKEKWGGSTRRHRTCTVAVSWAGRLAAPLLDRGAESPAGEPPNRQ